jgi:hypothetical protein
MKRTSLAMVTSALLLGGCSAGMQVTQDWDPDADFSGYRTFGWMPEEEARPQSQQLFTARVTAAVENTLTEKGLRLTSTDPDLLVAWDAATEGKQSMTTHGTAYGGGYGRYRRGRGGWGGGISTSTTTVNEWTEGTLIIDLIDTRMDELVYRGTGQAKLHEDLSPEERTANVNEAVGKILEKFPAGQ